MNLILLIVSIVRDISFGLIFTKDNIFNYFNPNVYEFRSCNKVSMYSRYDTLISHRPWQDNSKGLYCFFNGLNSHPCIFKRQIELVPEEYDVYAPHIPARQPLLTVSEPILEMIKTYTTQFPNNPICLMGLSNGARITLWVEIQLRTISPDTRIFISSLAGPLRGTYNMNRLKWIYDTLNVHNSFLKYLLPYYHPKLMEELVWDSSLSKELLENLLVNHNHTRVYHFYASTEDLVVPEVKSAVPFTLSVLDKANFGVNCEFYTHIVHGEGHNSILSRVCERQMKDINEWM